MCYGVLHIFATFDLISWNVLTTLKVKIYYFFDQTSLYFIYLFLHNTIFVYECYFDVLISMTFQYLASKLLKEQVIEVFFENSCIIDVPFYLLFSEMINFFFCYLDPIRFDLSFKGFRHHFL